MKRISAISILVIFIFGMLGYFPVFKLQQWQAHEEMERILRRTVPENELSVIKVTAQNEQELDWGWNRKEFTFKGKMYDVVRSENIGAETWYYCVSDEKETVLYAQMEVLAKKQGTGPFAANLAKNLAKMLVQTYIPSKGVIFPLPKDLAIFNSTSLVFHSSFVAEQPSPPPKA